MATDARRKRSESLKEVVTTTLVRGGATRLVFLNVAASGAAGLVLVWTHQKYWQESAVPLAYFGVLYATYNLLVGLAGRCAGAAAARYGRRPLLAAVGTLPIVVCVGMASFVGWGGIALGAVMQMSRGVGSVLFMTALNEKLSSAFRATVISMAQLCTRASFALLGPLVGYGIDAWGLPSVLLALGVLFSVTFTCLLLPLILRETALSPAAELRA